MRMGLLITLYPRTPAHCYALRVPMITQTGPTLSFVIPEHDGVDHDPGVGMDVGRARTNPDQGLSFDLTSQSPGGNKGWIDWCGAGHVHIGAGADDGTIGPSMRSGGNRPGKLGDDLNSPIRGFGWDDAKYLLTNQSDITTTVLMVNGIKIITVNSEDNVESNEDDAVDEHGHLRRYPPPSNPIPSSPLCITQENKSMVSLMQ
ncbi:hypothetical protein EDB89DRAFT_108694 [Lactarius sanguifluus]|nr:hypothetical protein EDB89DRAFT_108694 [Lactarius sanguifluus]